MRSKLAIALILGLLPVTAMAGDRYGRGYYGGGHYDRGSRYGGGHSHSSFGFSLGFGGGGYYRPYSSYYYAPRAYYPAPAYYYAPPPVYYAPPVYRSYYYDDSCYSRPSYNFGFYYRGR